MQRLKTFLSLLLLLTLFVALLALGTWQLKRLREKNIITASLTMTLAGPPLELDSIESIQLYSKVKLRGHFLQGHDIYLYGRKGHSLGKEGCYLLSPFQLKNNGEADKIIMVARGWFPLKSSTTPDFSAPLNSSNINFDEYENITGIALPGERSKTFMPANDLQDNLWFTLDLTQMSSFLQIPLAPFYLLQVETANLPAGLTPLTPDHLLKTKNNHLEYALTWFGLAGALTVISFLRFSKQGRRNPL